MLKKLGAASCVILCLAACPLKEAGAPAAGADNDGRPLPAGPFHRVISLYSAHTENLFALGAGETLIGGHKTCNWPPEAALLPVYDYTGDPEYVIAAQPDLVLIRPYIRRHNPGYIAELEKAGIPVVSLYASALDDFDAYITALAALTGAASAEPLRQFHAALDEISADSLRHTKPRVFFEATENAFRTAAKGSLPALAIQLAGGINIAEDAPPVNPSSSIAPFGMERLLAAGESIDVYVVQTGPMNSAVTPEKLKRRPGFQTIKAVREGRVLFIDEKELSSPSFRYLDGVRKLALFLRAP